MGLEDAIHMALLTLKEGFDGDVTSKNIEVGVVREDTKKKERLKKEGKEEDCWEFVVLDSNELQDYLDQVS